MANGRGSLLPGLAAALLVTLAAYAVHGLPFAPFTVTADGRTQHPVSADLLAILAGLIIANAIPLPQAVQPGCQWIVRCLIPVSVVLMGASLNLTRVAAIGLPTLLVIAVCIALATIMGRVVGRRTGLSAATSLLIGVGTGVCGSSAIVAIAPLIKAEEDDLILSIATINLFGLVAMLVYPVIAAALHIAPAPFAVWCGSSIHSVPQVLGAAFSQGMESGTLAALVKLVRISMLAPLVLFVAMIAHRRRDHATEGRRPAGAALAAMIPWFVWGFLAMALLNTLGLVPQFKLTFPSSLSNDVAGGPALPDLLKESSKFLLALSMAAIGLDVDLRRLISDGHRALLTGLLTTLLTGGISLLLVQVLIA